MNELYYSIKDNIDRLEVENITFHTNLIRGIRTKSKNKEQLLQDQCELLIGFDRNVFMPVFNYDFPRTKIFDVQNDHSKIGAINEFFKNNYAEWQTPVPIFSYAGNGSYPDIKDNSEIDPFDKNSIFGYLHKSNSLIMYYGAMLSSTTYIHYIERVSGLLTYRYDKWFDGKVIQKEKEMDVRFKYHVRPMGKYFDYDWPRIEEDLMKENLLAVFKKGVTDVKIIKTDELSDFWLERMKEDHLYFLDGKSRSWVEPMLHDLGRSFLLTDFE